MAQKIKIAHDRINLALSKELGKYYTPEEIDLEIFAESMNLFKQVREVYAQTSQISNDMRPFVVQRVLQNPINGVFILPDDVELIIDAVVEGTNTLIKVVEFQFLATRLNDPLFGPSIEYPMANVTSDSFAVYGLEDGKNVRVTYLKRPVLPVFGYEVVNNEIVHLPSNSTEIEWDSIHVDWIVNKVIANLSVGMRELDVNQIKENEPS